MDGDVDGRRDVEDRSDLMSCRDLDRPTYSASVEERAIIDCSWDDHKIGMPQYLSK